jgi:5-methylcytosine-specific restriction endonuclease McrA
MNNKNSRCLVLNADYTPLAIISWKRALVWSIKHDYNPEIGVDIIDFYKDDYIVGTNNKKYPIPAVARSARYFKQRNQTVNFSRKNIFIRDNYSCQYCGLKKDIAELTYDHVIPKSAWNHNQGSPTNWTNIVTACVSCNRKKGNKTPKQANMPLRSLPVMPSKTYKYLPITNFLHRIRVEIPQEWIPYLPESYYNAII